MVRKDPMEVEDGSGAADPNASIYYKRTISKEVHMENHAKIQTENAENMEKDWRLE